MCHPQHTLFICSNDKECLVGCCNACNSLFNGFSYYCKSCSLAFDVGCCFLPNRIQHNVHKHPLSLRAQRSTDDKHVCRACGFNATSELEFGCEACSYMLHIRCTLFPDTVRHKWDPHPLPLMYPPFYDHGGEMYCEICEEEVDLNYWLYRCVLCDQSFHVECLLGRNNFKITGQVVTLEAHPHPLSFVEKRYVDGPILCSVCRQELPDFQALLECCACSFLICPICISAALHRMSNK